MRIVEDKPREVNVLLIAVPIGLLLLSFLLHIADRHGMFNRIKPKPPSSDPPVEESKKEN